MQQSGNGYYDVVIRTTDEAANRYRVYASSDYAAAVLVRRATGFMAQSEDDVIFVSTYAGQQLPVQDMMHA